MFMDTFIPTHRISSLCSSLVHALFCIFPCPSFPTVSSSLRLICLCKGTCAYKHTHTHTHTHTQTFPPTHTPNSISTLSHIVIFFTNILCLSHKQFSYTETFLSLSLSLWLSFHLSYCLFPTLFSSVFFFSFQSSVSSLVLDSMGHLERGRDDNFVFLSPFLCLSTEIHLSPLSCIYPVQSCQTFLW